MNAEEAFLPELEAIHAQFPKLRIVLEHVTTAAAVDMVSFIWQKSTNTHTHKAKA